MALDVLRANLGERDRGGDPLTHPAFVLDRFLRLADGASMARVSIPNRGEHVLEEVNREPEFGEVGP